MEQYIIGGLVGVAIGVFLQRMVIYFAVDSISPTICDYCHWKKANEWRWNDRKSRHKK